MGNMTCSRCESMMDVLVYGVRNYNWKISLCWSHGVEANAQTVTILKTVDGAQLWTTDGSLPKNVHAIWGTRGGLVIIQPSVYGVFRFHEGASAVDSISEMSAEPFDRSAVVFGENGA